MTTEQAFNVIMQSELFRLNGPKIDLCEALQSLCSAIKGEEETNWSLGDGLECTLDSLLVGAYWALTHWHAGQSSQEYATLCAIGGIFSPGCTSAPTSNEESEYWPYVVVNNYFADKLGNPELRIES